MFLEYYGLTEQPFGVTPDPRFLQLGPKHREALASLLYGTETGQGFLALIAMPGMGKTSLLAQYVQSYAKKARICHVFQTDCDSRQLLRQILSQVGIQAGTQDLPTMRDSLNRVLLQEREAGRRFVLIIDEAQNLDEKVLESVRLLSNFETTTSKLVQIVLAGQPQLAERLTRPSMVQFRQRVSIIIRLEPFTPDETNAYIDHRLRIAGYKGLDLFTAPARLLIAQHSGGIPRNINSLCFNALSIGYAMRVKQIDSKIMREVISDLEIDSLVPRAKPTTADLPSIRVPIPSSSVSRVPAIQPRVSSGIRPRGSVPAIASVAAVLILVASGIAWNRAVETAAPQTKLKTEVPRPWEATGAPLTQAGGETDSSRAGSTSNQESPQTNSAGDARLTGPIIATVVEEASTLRQLSLKYLGRYDRTTTNEILKLNPAVTNPDHIIAGQHLRLPFYLRRERHSETDTGSGPVQAHKEKL